MNCYYPNILNPKINNLNKKNIYIIGSGWGSTAFIKHIDKNKYNIIVISKTQDFLYTPLLANNIKNDLDLETNINNINHNIEFEKDEVIDVNFNNNYIITKDNKYLKYDYLILSHGSIVNTYNIEGVNENCYFLKTKEDSEKIKNKLTSLDNGSNICVIGCGLTGSEVIGNLLDYDKFNIFAFDTFNLPLPTFSMKNRLFTYNLWKINNVNLNFESSVKKIDSTFLYYKYIEDKNDDNLKKMNYNMIIWTGGLKMCQLTEKILKNLNINNKFGIPVNKYLNIENLKNVYAIGDCSYSDNPPTAQLAYQQGKYLAHNFNNDFKNILPFKYNNKGSICYVGKNKSVFDNNYFQAGGNITYYLNRIIHFYNKMGF
jgi:NADH:ubiquinone reductase (non-electrogenic)